MIETFSKRHCNCCGGTGVQIDNQGIRHECPACGGKGWRWASNYEDLPPGAYCYNGNMSQTTTVNTW